MRPDPHRLTDLVESLDHHISQVRQENPDSIMIITPRTRSQIDDQEACSDTPHRANSITESGPDPTQAVTASALLDYDTAKNAQAVDTLYCYLECGGNYDQPRSPSA
jgi:hypothetical protein